MLLYFYSFVYILATLLISFILRAWLAWAVGDSRGRGGSRVPSKLFVYRNSCSNYCGSKGV